MSKNTFYLLLGGFIALWLSGISGVVGFALCTALFAVAGYAFDLVKHFVTGIKSGMAERSSHNPGKPVLRVVK